MASDLKSDGSLITACDRWSDATLVEGLARLFPGEGVLSEEGDKTVPKTSAYWVVDPLDGTTNFAAGIPYWAISIARFEAGRPVLAVLDVPPLRQRIVAIRGQGAWRNGRPLLAPSGQSHPAGCASLCSRSIGVLQSCPINASLEKSVCLGWLASTLSVWLWGKRSQPSRPRPRSGIWQQRGWCSASWTARSVGWCDHRSRSMLAPICQQLIFQCWRLIGQKPWPALCPGPMRWWLGPCHKGRGGDMFLNCAQGGRTRSEQAYDEGGESRRCCKFSESLRGDVPPRTPERRKRKHLDN